MATASRFDAQTVGRLATVNKGRRFEMELSDPEDRTIIVSLPLALAVELACMICDISENAPYLVGGVRISRKRRSSGRYRKRRIAPARSS